MSYSDDVPADCGSFTGSLVANAGEEKPANMPANNIEDPALQIGFKLLSIAALPVFRLIAGIHPGLHIINKFSGLVIAFTIMYNPFLVRHANALLPRQ